MRLLQAAALVALVGLASALDNGVARTPPMGWNSWNHFGGGVSAEVMMGTADAFLSRGLAAAGYTFINTDDGWLNKGRDHITGEQVRGLHRLPL